MRFALIFGIVILIPPIIFSIKFYAVPISNDISDWGAYGDYFGGILNPIIALVGTGILGYLSYQISKQSTDENKNLFLFEQRLFAYQRVSFLMNDIQKIVNKNKVNSMLVERLVELNDKENIKIQSINSYQNLLYTFSKINVELKYFPLNYSHLFKYNFSSKKYMSLLKNSHDFFHSFDYSSNEAAKKSVNSSQGDELFEELRLFVEELKKEITEH